MYKIVIAKSAVKDFHYLKASGLDKKVKHLLDILREDPLQTPPSYEKLVGDLRGLYSRRINIRHRLVYQIDMETETVKILSAWSHYEGL